MCGVRERERERERREREREREKRGITGSSHAVTTLPAEQHSLKSSEMTR